MKGEDKAEAEALESKEAGIPKIGEGNHWYDLAYWVVNWTLAEERRFLPKAVRQWAGNARITLHSYYELLHINKGDWPHGDSQNVVASGAVHVYVPGVWIVELFPPSKRRGLAKALDRKPWVSGYRRTFGEAPNDTVEDARGSISQQWWKLGTIISKRIDGWIPGSVRGNLPEPFSSVTVDMVQIGSSITAICAFFEVDKEWSSCLDREWHTAHHPAMYTPIGCPRQLSPRSREHKLAIRNVQSRICSDARMWMAKRFEGIFASWSKPQPALQIMLFDGSAASALLTHSLPNGYTLVEQLGLDTFQETTVENLPALGIRDCQKGIQETMDEVLGSAVGATNDVRDGLGDRLLGYLPEGMDVHYAITHCLHIEMRDLLLVYSLVRYTACLLRVYGRQRDWAGDGFGSYRPRQVNAFRRFVLDNSIDIREAKSDAIASLKQYGKIGPSLETRPIGKLANKEACKPVDESQRLITVASQNLDRLVELDSTYREVLATIVSLGTDNRSLLLARIALWVSVVSLVLALLTMDTCGDTFFAFICSWLRALSN